MRLGTIVCLALALSMPLAASAEEAGVAPAPAKSTVPPTAGDVADVARFMGILNVRIGKVDVADGALRATDIQGNTPGRPGMRGPGVSVGALSIADVRIVDGRRVFGSVGFEDLRYLGNATTRTVVTDLAMPVGKGVARFTSLQADGVRPLPGSGARIGFEGLRIVLEDWRDGAPMRYVVKARGITDTAMRGLPWLPPGIGLDATASYDPATSRMSMDDVTLWVGKTATVTASLAFDGVDRDAFTLAQTALGSVVSQGDETVERRLVLFGRDPRIRSATLRLWNQGLVQDALGAYAKAAGVAPSLLGQLLLEQVRQGLEARGLGGRFGTGTMAALRAFLADPRTLTLSVTPSETRPALMGLALGIERAKASGDLGIALTANEGTR